MTFSTAQDFLKTLRLDKFCNHRANRSWSVSRKCSFILQRFYSKVEGDIGKAMGWHQGCILMKVLVLTRKTRFPKVIYLSFYLCSSGRSWPCHWKGQECSVLYSSSHGVLTQCFSWSEGNFALIGCFRLLSCHTLRIALRKQIERKSVSCFLQGFMWSTLWGFWLNCLA